MIYVYVSPCKQSSQPVTTGTQATQAPTNAAFSGATYQPFGGFQSYNQFQPPPVAAPQQPPPPIIGTASGGAQVPNSGRMNDISWLCLCMVSHSLCMFLSHDISYN